MVVPLVLPRTRTGLPLVMAFAVVALVRLRYVVEEVLLTVAFWPADVETAKLAADTLLIVPATPPAAGPERAFDAVLAANPTVDDGPLPAPVELVLEVAPTIPAAPPAIPTTAAPTARFLLSL